MHTDAQAIKKLEESPETWEESLRSEAEDRDRIFRIAESALHVRNQSGFYLWSQGMLQAAIPHEILVCGVKTPASNFLQMHRYSSCRYFGDRQFAMVADQNNGIVSRLVNEWLLLGRPCFAMPGADPALDRELIECELKNAVGHGVWGTEGDVIGFFCFSRTSLTPNPASIRMLEIVIPIVFVTLLRVLAGEYKPVESLSRTSNLVTPREVEILGWIKEGKRTADIASILKLSPFTVKNHVQSILKKLGARSRSHAVAQAIGLGLLDSGRS